MGVVWQVAVSDVPVPAVFVLLGGCGCGSPLASVAAVIAGLWCGHCVWWCGLVVVLGVILAAAGCFYVNKLGCLPLDACFYVICGRFYVN